MQSGHNTSRGQYGARSQSWCGLKPLKGRIGSIVATAFDYVIFDAARARQHTSSPLPANELPSWLPSSQNALKPVSGWVTGSEHEAAALPPLHICLCTGLSGLRR